MGEVFISAWQMFLQADARHVTGGSLCPGLYTGSLSVPRGSPAHLSESIDPLREFSTCWPLDSSRELFSALRSAGSLRELSKGRQVLNSRKKKRGGV